MHEALYKIYTGIFRACVNSVYQASPRGGGGGGDKAIIVYTGNFTSYK